MQFLCVRAKPSWKIGQFKPSLHRFISRENISVLVWHLETTSVAQKCYVPEVCGAQTETFLPVFLFALVCELPTYIILLPSSSLDWINLDFKIHQVTSNHISEKLMKQLEHFTLTKLQWSNSCRPSSRLRRTVHNFTEWNVYIRVSLLREPGLISDL